MLSLSRMDSSEAKIPGEEASSKILLAEAGERGRHLKKRFCSFRSAVSDTLSSTANCWRKPMVHT